MGDIADPENHPAEPPLRRPAHFTAEHDVSGFNSGRPELDEWLTKRALASESKTSRTYVVASVRRVVAYYTLSSGSILRETLPNAKLRRNAPEQVPVIVMGRLAVDSGFSGRGIGRGLLQEAITRTLLASREVGVRGLVIHAIDEQAGGFYAKFGFIRCLPLGGLTFILPIETAVNAMDG